MSPRHDEPPGLRSRRDFLRRILRRGAYVPPTVLAMSIRNIAVAQSTCPGQGNCGNAPPVGKCSNPNQPNCN